MKKTVNTYHCEGYVYDVSKLKSKVSGPNSKNPGTPFIQGEMQVATDEECTNIVTLHFTYVTPTFKSGKEDTTFTLLNQLIADNSPYFTVMNGGKDKALKVRVDGSVDVNTFWDKDDQQVDAKRIEGRFVHATTDITADEKEKNKFTCDMVITGMRRVEADPEKELPEKGYIKGAIFDFRGALLPVEFAVINPRAIDYFENLEVSASDPVFTKISGQLVSTTIVKTYTEESAFGDPDVRTVTSSRKDWVVTWAPLEPYVFGETDTITAEELKKAIADREIYVAAEKQRTNEWRANQNGGGTSAFDATPQGEFKF